MAWSCQADKPSGHLDLNPRWSVISLRPLLGVMQASWVQYRRGEYYRVSVGAVLPWWVQYSLGGCSTASVGAVQPRWVQYSLGGYKRWQLGACI